MNLPVRFNQQVPKELRNILSYYEVEAGGNLADAFYEKLMDCVHRIERNPKRFSFFRGDIRRANLDRFPYTIFIESRPTASESLF